MEDGSRWSQGAWPRGMGSHLHTWSRGWRDVIRGWPCEEPTPGRRQALGLTQAAKGLCHDSGAMTRGSRWLDQCGHCILSAPATQVHVSTRFLSGKWEKRNIPLRVSPTNQGTPQSSGFRHGWIQGLGCLVSWCLSVLLRLVLAALTVLLCWFLCAQPSPRGREGGLGEPSPPYLLGLVQGLGEVWAPFTLHQSQGLGLLSSDWLSQPSPAVRAP